MFVATQCIRPPHAIEQTVTLATRLVSDRVTPINRPTACMNVTIEEGSAAKAVSGAVFFRVLDWSQYDRPTARWDRNSAATVLHEVLHQVGLRYGVTDATLPVEEGLTEAVTYDLMPAFTRRMKIYGQPRMTLAYPRIVERVRDASEIATGEHWRSPAARAWRIQMIATPPVYRVLG